MTDKGQRSYIAIDLKSFYASVECKEKKEEKKEEKKDIRKVLCNW